jgi:hypothetical protein
MVINSDGFIPAKRVCEYALGVDLGKKNDSTAIALVERLVEPVPPHVEGWCDSSLRQRVYPARFTVVAMDRVPLGTSYVEVAQRVATIMQKFTNAELVVDISGVGQAVADIFRDFGLHFTGVSITGGRSESADPNDYSQRNVPKLDLVSVLQAAFARADLKIAQDLPFRDVLVKELRDFEMKVSDVGNMAFGARSGQHDDLVLAVAIACWKLKGPRQMRVAVQPIFL